MIRYIAYKDIDKNKWDDCLLNASNGLIFGFSFYLDAVCDEWDALVMDEYDAVFPITRKSKLGIHYLFNPIFALQLGIFSKEPVTFELVSEFISRIPPKIKLTDIYLNYGNSFESKEYTISQKVCQKINLSKPYEEIAIHYSTNLKRNLSKARKNKLEIVLSSDEKTVVKLFRENGGEDIKDITDQHFIRLEKLIANLKEKKCVKIYECWLGKEQIASACFSVSNNRIIYIKGGSTKTGRELGAMHLIMDEVIHLNSGKNLVFDFGGSSIPQVARFNANFGAEDYNYTRIYKNNLPFFAKLITKK